MRRMILLKRRLAAPVLVALAASLLSLPAAAQEQKHPTLLVFAAASLTNALDDLSAAWTATSGVPVKLSFAASSVLARQIEAGGKLEFVMSDRPSRWASHWKP